MEESGKSSPDRLTAVPKISILGATPIQSPENSSDDEARTVSQHTETDNEGANAGSNVMDGENERVNDGSNVMAGENGADDISEEHTLAVQNDDDLDTENGDESHETIPSEDNDEEIDEVTESHDVNQRDPEKDEQGATEEDINKSSSVSETIIGKSDVVNGDHQVPAMSVSLDSGIASFAATSASTKAADTTNMRASADGSPDDRSADTVKEEDAASDVTPDVDRGQVDGDVEEDIDFTIDTDDYGQGGSGLPPQLGNFMFLSGMPPWGTGMSPMGSLLADIITAKMEDEDRQADTTREEQTNRRRMKRESSEDDASSLEEQEDKWQDLMRLLEEQYQQQLLMQQQQHDQQLKMVQTQVEYLAKRKQQRKARYQAQMKTQERKKDNASDAKEQTQSKKEDGHSEMKEGDEDTLEKEESEDVDGAVHVNGSGDVDGTVHEEAVKSQDEVIKAVDEKGDARDIQEDKVSKSPASVTTADKKTTNADQHNDSEVTVLSDYSYWRVEEQDSFKELPNITSNEMTSSPNTDDGAGSSPPVLHRSFSSPTMSDAFLNSSQRLTLREKHARHMADLRAYYEAEINELKDQLSSSSNVKTKSPYRRLERNNAKLKERCERLEIALKSANSRIEELENTVLNLQIQVTDGAQRYEIACGTVKALEQRIENLKLYCKQKESQLQRADRRNRELDVSLQNAYRLQDEQYSRTDSKSQEILEKLMVEYEALGNEHDNTKIQLSKTETDLYDSKSEVANLKRTVSKLELEIKRLDRENTIMRECGYSPTISLSRMKDKLSETRPSTEPPSTHRKWLQSSVDYNMFTGEDKSNAKTDLTTSYLGNSLLNSTGGPSSRNVSGYYGSLVASSNDPCRPISPMIRAAVQLDKWKESEKQRQTSPGHSSPSPSKVDFTSTYARLPDTRTSPRSSSFTRSPRSNMGHSMTSPGRSYINSTHDTSPRFQGLLNKSDSNTTRFDISAHDLERPVRDDSPRKVERSPARDWLLDSPNTTARSAMSNSSPRTTPTSNKRRSPQSRVSDSNAATRLDFSSTPRTDVGTPADAVLERVKTGVYTASPRYEKTSKKSKESPEQRKHANNSESEIMQRIRKIRETEKRLDELIEEKKQLESSLSRIPNSGPRATPQTRRDQEKIEKRLDDIASELGTIRMILRKHHVIKT
ncbi:M-phase phosphoprotein 9-like [Ptychodera flava]|uniref:M-phase phosphoprotein 9-like n=1 Tax=Ptychodera flava TaxID=63121 RepID=UPI00396A5F93